MEKLSIGKGEVTPSLAAPPSRKENWRWGGGRGGIRTPETLGGGTIVQKAPKNAVCATVNPLEKL